MTLLRLPTRFRIAVLECPYETWSDQATQELFCQIVDLKLRGFLTGYADGVLPVDGSDFVCTHLAVCAETHSGLKPLLAYRSISAERARKHAMKFPGLSLVEGAKVASPDHVEAVRELMSRCEAGNQTIRYCSSYTILPELRGDRELVAQLKIYMTGMHLLFHRDFGTRESLLGGVVRFKTDEYFANWGYERLRLGERELGTLSNSTLFGEPVYVMRLKEWSAHAQECAEKTRALWERKIVLEAAPAAQAVPAARERKAA